MMKIVKCEKNMINVLDRLRERELEERKSREEEKMRMPQERS